MSSAKSNRNTQIKNQETPPNRNKKNKPNRQTDDLEWLMNDSFDVHMEGTPPRVGRKKTSSPEQLPTLHEVDVLLNQEFDLLKHIEEVKASATKPKRKAPSPKKASPSPSPAKKVPAPAKSVSPNTLYPQVAKTLAWLLPPPKTSPSPSKEKTASPKAKAKTASPKAKPKTSSEERLWAEPEDLNDIVFPVLSKRKYIKRI